ncbi:apolipoprotein N-acyltransferase [Methylocucumis oryzae]|nr:apolipoprotein N-acyltransferase [Methylocucumis oryzae]
MPLINPIFYDLMALCAGGLFTLAFAPFNFSVLAIPALALLFASWQTGCTPLRASLRGFYFGLAAFALGVSWVYISIHDFGGADSVSSAALTLTFVAFWALFPALAGFLTVTLSAANAPIITAGIWLGIEYLRGTLLLNGFPWLLSGYSQLNTPLAGYIPLLGAYGTGFLLVLTTTLLLSLFTTQTYRMLKAGLLLILWLTGAGLHEVEWTKPQGKALTVALIQGNIAQNEKWLPENKLDTLRLYRDLTEEHWDADVIIWPETSIPAFLSEVDEFYLTPLQQAAQQHNTDIIVSLPTEGERGEVYNSVLALGQQRQIYSKNHLLPFGETMPLQPLSGYILKQLNIGLGDFTPGGAHQPLLTAAGLPFITSICYEDAFGVTVADGLEQAAFLVNVTNDAWFGDSLEPQQHLQMAAMRALESGRYLLRATNTGVSAVINAKGQTVAEAPSFTTTVLTASFQPMTGLTPYAWLGDTWLMGGILLITLASLGYLHFAEAGKHLSVFTKRLKSH